MTLSFLASTSAFMASSNEVSFESVIPLAEASAKGITLSNETSLEDAMKALVEAKKDSVIVVKDDKKLGSVSMYDIVHAATRSSETAGEAVTYR